MKIITKLLSIIVLFASLASCGDEDDTKDLVEQLKTSYVYDGQAVELVGYIAIPKSQLIKSGKVYIQFDDIPNQHAGGLGKIEMIYGKGVNQIYFPSNYTFSSIQIYDNDGVVCNSETKIKITGIVSYPFIRWKDIIDEDLNLFNTDKTSTSIRVSQRAMEIKKEFREKALNEALKREKATGDPNDYTYYIIAQKIEVVE